MRRKMIIGVVLLAAIINAIADIMVSDVQVLGCPWNEVEEYIIMGSAQRKRCLGMRNVDVESCEKRERMFTNVHFPRKGGCE